MMQATDFRDLNNLSHFWGLNCSWIRRVLLQRQMRSRIEVVPEVSFQDPSQMPLSEYDHVIEALSANAPNQPFRKRILPWTSRRCEHLFDSHSLNPVSEMATVDSVTVPYQISRHSIFWERFDDLLRRPFCSGMLSNIEMQHAATIMCQHNEYK